MNVAESMRYRLHFSLLAATSTPRTGDCGKVVLAGAGCGGCKQKRLPRQTGPSSLQDISSKYNCMLQIASTTPSLPRRQFTTSASMNRMAATHCRSNTTNLRLSMRMAWCLSCATFHCHLSSLTNNFHRQLQREPCWATSVGQT